MSRIRENNDLPTSITMRSCPVGQPCYDVTDEVVLHTELCEDTVTPRFRQRIKRGEVINNNCFIQHRTFSYSGGHTYDLYADASGDYVGSGSTTNGGYRKAVEGYLPINTDRSWSHEGMIADAKLKALAKIDSTPYGFAEDLAELKKSIRYFRDLSLNIKDASENFKRLKRRLFDKDGSFNSKKSVEQLDDIYLQYRFAISPTIRSIMDLMEAMNEEKTQRYYREQYPTRRTARGFSKTEWARSNSQTISVYDITSEVEGEQHVHAGILYDIKNPVGSFRWKYGLRNRDILPTMWEILPLSFMVDRVYNIKNALKGALNLADPNINILAAWTTSRKKEKHRVKNTMLNSYWSDGDIRYERYGGYSRKYENFEYDRVVWTPSIEDLAPPVTLGNAVDDLPKILDIFALAESILTRKA